MRIVTLARKDYKVVEHVDQVDHPNARGHRIVAHTQDFAPVF
jgi:hypothetical protein